MLDHSAMTVVEEPLPGVDQTHTKGIYALGQPKVLRKMSIPGRDPGLTEFTDRRTALQAALAVFKYGGRTCTLMLFRRTAAGQYEPVAFLRSETPQLVPDASAGGKWPAVTTGRKR